MDPSRNRNSVLAEFVGDSLDLEEDVIHLTKLLFSIPVVCPGLGAVFHPLVTVLALMIVVLSMPYSKFEGRTRALV